MQAAGRSGYEAIYTYLTLYCLASFINLATLTYTGITRKTQEYAQYLKSLYRTQTLASSSVDEWPPPCTDKVFRLAMIKAEEMRRGHTEDDAVLREKTISGRVDDVLQRMIPVEIQG